MRFVSESSYRPWFTKSSTFCTIVAVALGAVDNVDVVLGAVEDVDVVLAELILLLARA